MTTETTSLAPPNSARDEWRALGSFIRVPHLPQAARPLGAAPVLSVLRLLALDLMIMAVLVGIALGVEAAGFELPENVLEKLEIGLPLVMLMVVGAPLMEETIFRSWLSGRPGHVLAVLAVLLFALGAPFAAGFFGLGNGGKSAAALIGGAGVLAGIAAAIFVLWYFRGRGPWRWYARHFRWFYYGSALAFASVHLTNYTEGNAIFLLPLTIPQLILGLFLGYTRVVNGFWSAILLHALHNGIAVSLVLLFADMA